MRWDCRTLHAGDSLEQLFGDQWISVECFNRIDRRHVDVGASIKVPKGIEDQEFFAPRMALKQDAKRNLVTR